MQRFFVMLFMVVGIAVLGMLGVRYFVRVEHYQQELSLLIHNRTSLKVAQGVGKLVWTPLPALEIDQVSISKSAEDKPFIVIPKMKAELDVFSFITGKCVVRRLALQEPEMVLSEETLYALKSFAGTLHGLFGNTLTDISVTKGRALLLENQGEHIDDFDLRLSFKNKDTLSFSGKGLFLKNRWVTRGYVEKFFQDMPRTFRLVIQDERSLFKLEGNGTFRSLKNIQMDGYARVTEPNTFLELFGFPNVISQFNVPTLGNFSFEKTPDQITFSDFTIKIGEDNPLLMNGRYSKKEDKHTLGLFIHELTDKMIVEQLALFRPFFLQNKADLTFQLGIDKLHCQNVTGTDGNVSGQLLGNNLTIETGKISLGKDITLAFEGNGKDVWLPAYEWNLKCNLKATQLMPLLKEISQKFSRFSDTLFPKADILADVGIGSDHVFIKVTEGKINETALSGTFKKAEGESFVLELQADTVPLTTYLKDIFPDIYAPTYQQLGLRERLFSFLKQPILQKIPEGTFNFSLKNVQFLDQKVGSMAGTIEAGHQVLSLKNVLVEGLSDTAVEISGAFTQLGQEAPVIEKGLLTLESENFPELYQKLAGEKAPFVEDKSVKMSLEVEGIESKLYLKNNLKSPTVSFEGQGTILWQPSIYFDKFALKLVYPNFHSFLRQINIDGDLFKKFDGVLKVSSVITGQKNQFSAQELNASIGIQNVSGDFQYTGGEQSVLKGNLVTDFIDISKILPPMSPGKNIDFLSLYPSFTDIRLTAGQAKYKDMVFKDTQFSYHQEGKNILLNGKLENEKIDFTAKIKNTEVPETSLKLNLKDFTLKGKAADYGDYYFGSGVLSGQGEMTCQGTTWDTCLPSMQGKFSFQGKRNMLVGIDIPGLQRLMNQGAMGLIQQQKFQGMLVKTLGQGIWTLSDTLISGQLTPYQITWQTRLMGGDASLHGDWKYDFKIQEGNGKGGVLFSVYEKLGEIPLSGSYRNNLLKLEWLAPDLYASVLENIVPVMRTQQEQNTIEKKFSASWRQKTLEYQGMWQDLMQWGKLPVNQEEQKEAQDLKKRWDEFGLFSQNALSEGALTAEELQMAQNKLIKEIENLHQKMLSNLEKQSLSGEIY